jgi:hypothetical protein
MQVNVHLPEDIARNLAPDAQGLERTMLESLAAEGVRSGKLTRGQARRVLGFETRYEVDGFLKARGIPVQESLEEIQRDSELVLKLGRP